MKKFTNLLFLIMAIAFIVRLIGIGFGLPFAYHDDEPIIVNYALAYGSGDFNPHTFMISPFLSYLLFFVYGAFFAIGCIFRQFQHLADFAYLYLNDPTIFYLIARALYGLIFGTASVYLIYILGKRYFNKQTGILASLLLALNYIHVRDSHYIYFDIPLTFFILLFFIKANDLFKPSIKRSSYIWIGVLLGLASSVKYSGALMLFPLSIVLLYGLYRRKERALPVKLGDILYCGLGCLAVIFILNPFSFINFNDFIRSLSKMPFIKLTPHFHLKISLFNGCGMAMVILGIFGMVWSLLIRRNKQAFLIIYAFFYYWIISRASQDAERLVMPLVPFILVFAASIVIGGKSLIKNRALSNLLASLAIIALLYPSLIRIYYSDALFLKEDTRTQAYNWVKENIEKDARIALDATSSWFPKLEKSKDQIRESSKYFDKPQFDKPKGADELKLKFMLENPGYPEKTHFLFYLKETAGTAFVSVHPDLSTDYSELRANRIEYLLLSNTLIKERYKDFLDDVEDNGTLIKIFSPYKEEVDRLVPKEPTLPPAAGFMLEELKDRKSFGPVIKVYKLRD